MNTRAHSFLRSPVRRSKGDVGLITLLLWADSNQGQTDRDLLKQIICQRWGNACDTSIDLCSHSVWASHSLFCFVFFQHQQVSVCVAASTRYSVWKVSSFVAVHLHKCDMKEIQYYSHRYTHTVYIHTHIPPFYILHTYAVYMLSCRELDVTIDTTLMSVR